MTDWEPSEVFSPSGLSLAGRCLTAWSRRYLHGQSELGVKRATVLGLIIHACIEAHYQGGNLYRPVLDERTKHDLNRLTSAHPHKIKELLDFAPSRAIAGLPFLPVADQCSVVQVERPLAFSPTPLSGKPVLLRGLIDLVTCDKAGWLLTDHKSTKGRSWDTRSYPAELNRPLAQRGDKFGGPWAYAKTAEELVEDIQANVYGYSVMVENGLDELRCRWIYYNTDPNLAPVAIAVDFTLRLNDTLLYLQKWLGLAQYLRGWVDYTVEHGPPTDEQTGYPDKLLPDPESPCAAFGGCTHHVDRGGTCSPGGSLAQRIALQFPEKEETCQ